jgi:Tubulin binding cofactor C
MLTLQNREDEIIAVSIEECQGQSITVKNLKNCQVNFLGTLGALYLYDCHGCDLSLAYVKTACNIYNCNSLKLKIVW